MPLGWTVNFSTSGVIEATSKFSNMQRYSQTIINTVEYLHFKLKKKITVTSINEIWCEKNLEKGRS